MGKATAAMSRINWSPNGSGATLDFGEAGVTLPLPNRDEHSGSDVFGAEVVGVVTEVGVSL